MWRGVPSEGHPHSAPTRRTHGWGGHGGSRGGRRPEGAGGEAARSSRRPAVRQECGEHDGGALRLALTRGACLAAVAAAGDGECAAGGGPGVAAPGAHLLAVDGQEAPPTPCLSFPSTPLPSRPNPPLPCPALATAALGLGGSSHFPGEKRGLRDAPSPIPEAGFSPGPWVSSVGLFQTSVCPISTLPSS